MIKWTTTKKEHKLISKIVKRAIKISPSSDFMDLTMDITACHLNGCPLDFKKLLAADDANLGHDVFGISKFINRNNGKLTNCFLPRCSA